MAIVTIETNVPDDIKKLLLELVKNETELKALNKRKKELDKREKEIFNLVRPSFTRRKKLISLMVDKYVFGIKPAGNASTDYKGLFEHACEVLGKIGKKHLDDYLEEKKKRTKAAGGKEELSFTEVKL